MDLLTRLERKFGRYAISNLSLYIVVTYAAGYLLMLTSSRLLGYLTLAADSAGQSQHFYDHYAAFLLFRGKYPGENLGDIPV